MPKPVLIPRSFLSFSLTVCGYSALSCGSNVPASFSSSLHRFLVSLFSFSATCFELCNSLTVS
ncbi:hypothetical protein BDV26DRAFT_251834 [Aspergillus bertholletiae]|uniref:Uncharacterized protein n=1 Tax=Aspergillus bertholletiae TaxID=1226010 RepID=A0A5N7BN18_9EURO|nr:hypothetical protein BDV26DRAFT_251834 [Aspergillus bertholletiae]